MYFSCRALHHWLEHVLWQIYSAGVISIMTLTCNWCMHVLMSSSAGCLADFFTSGLNLKLPTAICCVIAIYILSYFFWGFVWLLVYWWVTFPTSRKGRLSTSLNTFSLSYAL